MTLEELKKMTVEQLKAMAYDFLVDQQRIQSNLQAVNQVIAEKLAVKDKDAK